jgi:predicted transposase YbfD/YdcC
VPIEARLDTASPEQTRRVLVAVAGRIVTTEAMHARANVRFP